MPKSIKWSLALWFSDAHFSPTPYTNFLSYLIVIELITLQEMGCEGVGGIHLAQE